MSNVSFLYGVFDKVANFFVDIRLCANDNLASRDFYSRVRLNPNSPLALCPTDFSLKLLGEFDETTGVIKSYDPVTICPNALPPEVLSNAINSFSPSSTSPRASSPIE